MNEAALAPCPVCGSKTIYPYLEVRDHSVSGELFRLERCSACDFLRTDPQIPAAQIGPYYQSENYLSHAKTGKGLVAKFYARARQKMLAWKHDVVAGATGQASGRLLDYGTGIGLFPAYMARRGWQAEGVEPSEAARAVAKEQIGIEPMDTEQFWGLPAGSYQAITLWHVLEHVHELDRTLAKLADLLAPGGVLLIAVPNALSADAGHYQQHWAAWDVPRHLWHFSPDNLKQLVEKTGLRQTDLFALPLDAYYISLRSEQFQGRSLAPLRGWWRGQRFTRKARRNPHVASSILCVFQKTN